MIHGVAAPLVAFAITSFGTFCLFYIPFLLRSSKHREEEETRAIREVLKARTFGPLERRRG